MSVVLNHPLDRLSRHARPYPGDLLQGCETGLLLFCAAFEGINDGIHFARYGLRATCVDTDMARLAKMAAVYPTDWKFEWRDAWAFAEEAKRRGKMWDVVSVDTFTGDATDRSLESLDLWCALAHKAVTFTMSAGQSVAPPWGWHLDAPHIRSETVFWGVLRRDRP